MTPIALTIAASDPSGGAGLQQDLRTFAVHGVFGMAVPTALTAQHASRLVRVDPVPPGSVAAALTAIFEGRPPDVVKVGALGPADVAREALDALREAFARVGARPVVLDPVLSATAGGTLGTLDGVRAWLEAGVVTLLTPNLAEWHALTGDDAAEARRVAELARGLGARAVLLKGGHGGGPTATDVLFHEDGTEEFTLPRVALAGEVHGTGCALASAIAARLAHGDGLPEAVGQAKRWLTDALRAAEPHGAGWVLGPVS